MYLRLVARLVLATLLCAVVSGKTATADPKECEVCISVLEKVDAALDKKDRKKQSAIEAAIDKFCEGRLSAKDDKMCYYFLPIKKAISQPFSTGIPKNKVCQRLKKTNSEICEVKYPMKIEKGNVDYNKLRVKQLKAILGERGVDCNGCLEKTDFVKRCESTEHLEL